jgi:hypothetical protein
VVKEKYLKQFRNGLDPADSGCILTLFRTHPKTSENKGQKPWFEMISNHFATTPELPDKLDRKPWPIQRR